MPGSEIGVPRGIQETQPREVPLLAELCRGGGEEQQAVSGSGDALHRGVLGARLSVMPTEMVRLVDDHDVPSSRGGLFRPSRLVHQQGPAGEHELLALERIRLGRTLLDRDTAFLIEQGHAQVESSRELHQPLVHEGVRHQDQRPTSASRQ